MQDTGVSAVRAFNRFYTRQIGALDAGLVGTGFTLAEARLIYEVASRTKASAAEMARELGVDPGYLSRLVRKLADQGLLVLHPHTTDRRQQEIVLTAEGRATFTALDEASDAAVRAMLAPHHEAKRTALVAAMTTIGAVLGAGQAAPLVVRPHRVGEVAYAVSRQAVLYTSEYGWDGSYEGLALDIAGRFLANYNAARECCLVAERGGQIVGAVFIVDAGNDAAQLRLLYVEPYARGEGIGRLLVRESLQFARSAGYLSVKLWTQSILTAARKIYTAAGFGKVREERHTSFGKNLIGEYWELRFPDAPS